MTQLDQIQRDLKVVKRDLSKLLRSEKLEEVATEYLNRIEAPLFAGVSLRTLINHVADGILTDVLKNKARKKETITGFSKHELERVYKSKSKHN